jgi:DNA oxidative demethylase
MLFDDLPRPAVRVTDGVAHLPGWLPLPRQRDLVDQAREIARSVAGTPVAMHRPVVGSGQMSVWMMPLGRFWRTRPYGYVAEVDGTAVPPLPGPWQELAQAAVRAAADVDETLRPWAEVFCADIALVNYYPPGARMGMHVDADEASEAPVVSLSVGDEALFRIGGTENRNRPWDDVALLSGDLIVFGGPTRRAYHGVPAVRAGTLPPGCGLAEGRLNVTMRQLAD